VHITTTDQVNGIVLVGMSFLQVGEEPAKALELLQCVAVVASQKNFLLSEFDRTRALICNGIKGNVSLGLI
jgi:hypothetical protein